MIAPTYYRSLLPPEEQEFYKQIVNNLLQFHFRIFFRVNADKRDAIQNVIQAVHLDHPELFYVDFWSYTFQVSPLPVGIIIEFHSLLLEEAVYSVSNTLSRYVHDLAMQIHSEKNDLQYYYRIAHHISKDTSYVNSGSAFWEHTAAGPVLNHRCVCEGISKLYLYVCQRLELPCAVITGSLNGVPHGWNMIEVNNKVRYVDVTGMLNEKHNSVFYPQLVFKTEKQLMRAGYVWNSHRCKTVKGEV